MRRGAGVWDSDVRSWTQCVAPMAMLEPRLVTRTRACVRSGECGVALAGCGVPVRRGLNLKRKASCSHRKPNSTCCGCAHCVLSRRGRCVRRPPVSAALISRLRFRGSPDPRHERKVDRPALLRTWPVRKLNPYPTRVVCFSRPPISASIDAMRVSDVAAHLHVPWWNIQRESGGDQRDGPLHAS